MKIELQPGNGTFRKKLCPISKQKFIETGTYIFMVTDGKYKGQSVSPETALNKGFTMTNETYMQLQTAIKPPFAWDNAMRKNVARILNKTRTNIFYTEDKEMVTDPRTGRVFINPTWQKLILKIQEGLKEIEDYLLRETVN